MATTQKRAKIGGETGTNGEFYEGGKFLPSTERPKGKPKKSTGQHKQQIEPYVWVVAPEEGLRSILGDAVGIYARFDHKTGTLNWDCSEQTISYYDLDVAACKARIDAYNAGERWFKRNA